DAGTLRLFGHDVRRLRRSSLPMVRRKIGVVPQAFKLLPERTALDNVGVTLEVRGERRGEIRARAAAALAAVGLADRADALPAAMSMGEQQRVAIARALVGAPDALALDEPTGNLDAVTARELLWELEQLNAAGTTLIVTTNDRDVIDG